MANDSFLELSDAESDVSSLALLTLKRLARGIFQQIGLALISLIFVLNLTGQPAAHEQQSYGQQSYETNAAEVSTREHPPLPSATSSKAPSATSSEQASPEADSSQAAERPYQTLRPKLTHHRLTTARLAVPFFAAIVAVVSIAIDILNAYVDPRIRY